MHGAVDSAGAVCAEASALDMIVSNSSPNLADIYHMSSPSFNAVSCQLKAALGKKHYKNV